MAVSLTGVFPSKLLDRLYGLARFQGSYNSYIGHPYWVNYPTASQTCPAQMSRW